MTVTVMGGRWGSSSESMEPRALVFLVSQPQHILEVYPLYGFVVILIFQSLYSQEQMGTTLVTCGVL